MSVRIRLMRVGKGAKKKPFFRVCVIDQHKARDGKAIELIGIYDPTKVPYVFKINRMRLDYWKAKGAQVSETVDKLIKEEK